MQSVFAFTGASPGVVESWLDKAATRSENADQWFFPAEAGRRLRIEVADDLLTEFEDDLVVQIVSATATARPTCIVVDVSRGFERRLLVEFLLDMAVELGAVVMDDNSDHVWCSSDLERGTLRSGTRFAEGY